MTIPVVDLAHFLNGDAQQKQAFITALGTAYEEVGFAAVKNHGIPDALIRICINTCSSFLPCRHR
jgi:isopenicillin N synthase-like dioxygenase